MQHLFISVSSMRPAESFSVNLWSSETFSFSIWPVYSFELKTAGLKQMDKINFLFRPSSLARHHSNKRWLLTFSSFSSSALVFFTRCQFHPHFMSKFFIWKFVQIQILSREKLLKRLSYEKFVRIMLMKLTPGLYFTNILWAAFMCVDPKSAIKTDGLTVFFAFWGSECIKATCKILV